MQLLTVPNPLCVDRSLLTACKPLLRTPIANSGDISDRSNSGMRVRGILRQRAAPLLQLQLLQPQPLQHPTPRSGIDHIPAISALQHRLRMRLPLHLRSSDTHRNRTRIAHMEGEANSTGSNLNLSLRLLLLLGVC